MTTTLKLKPARVRLETLDGGRVGRCHDDLYMRTVSAVADDIIAIRLRDGALITNGHIEVAPVDVVIEEV